MFVLKQKFEKRKSKKEIKTIMEKIKKSKVVFILRQRYLKR